MHGANQNHFLNSLLPLLREFIWNDGPFLPPCRKDKEGGEATEGERMYVCVRTIRRRPPPPHSKSFTIYLGAFYSAFHMRRGGRGGLKCGKFARKCELRPEKDLLLRGQ